MFHVRLLSVLVPSSVAALTAIATVTTYTPQAIAIGLEGYYAPNNWTFNKSGSASTSDSTFTPLPLTSVQLTLNPINAPSDTISAEDYISWSIAAEPTGSPTFFEFDWQLATNDEGIHEIGYFVGSYTGFEPVLTSTNLASTSPVKVTVNSGETFGFYYRTNDNTFSDGNFIVSNFSATSATPVPFEFSPTLGFAVLGTGFTLNQGRKRLQARQSNKK